MKTPTIRFMSAALGIWLAAGGTALACPVCVGVSDSPLASGMNAGVLVLLGVTACVLGGIFFVGRRIVRGTVESAPGTQRAAPSAVRPEADPC